MLTITPEHEKLIQNHLDTGRYANAEEVLAIALQLLARSLVSIPNIKLGLKKLVNKSRSGSLNSIAAKALMVRQRWQDIFSNFRRHGKRGSHEFYPRAQYYQRSRSAISILS
jgi:Arc/MetJ-type ribon-helix-helix transcriptional regulator